MKLYESLSVLNEKWYDGETANKKIWFSDSAIEFKNFMRNLPNTGFKGVRLCIAQDFYLVAKAEDYDHATMELTAEDELCLDMPYAIEHYTCGVPKCTDFELGNFEVELLKKAAEANPGDEELAIYLDYDAAKDYKGKLIADYGTFEVNVYGFKTRAFPEYNTNKKYVTKYFEDSELYKALKPMLKRIYIYGT